MTRAASEPVRPEIVFSVSASACDFAEIARQTHSHGCPIELLADFTLASAGSETIRAGLAASNLKCAGLALSAEDSDLGASEAGKRSKSRERILTAIQDAVVVGASYVRICAARLMGPGAPHHQDAVHRALDALLALRHEAGLRGIRIVIHLAEHGFLASPSEARQFLDAVNSPWIGGSINPVMWASSAVAADWIESLAHRLAMVQLNAPADNGIEWGAIDQKLAAERFDGYIVTPMTPVNDIDKRLRKIRGDFPSLLPPV